MALDLGSHHVTFHSYLECPGGCHGHDLQLPMQSLSITTDVVSSRCITLCDKVCQ